LLGGYPLVAFVPTVDLERARAFYEGVAGLTVEEVTPFACVLRASGITLRVTRVEQLHPQPFTVLGWSVPDIRQAVEELTGRGVVFERYAGIDQDQLGVWTAPDGAQVAWFKDPDGNILSLDTQPARGSV
jgi:predicted enzyme related to lactoylglutathione lyase